MIYMKRRELLTSAIGVMAASTFPAGNGFAADFQGVGSRGEKVSLKEAAIADLQKHIKSAVVLPTSPDYESARKIWNGSFNNKHPALIVRCSDANEVVSAVQFARQHNLLTAVRCGGHSYSGQSTCDGGIVIDLGPFNKVTVDPGKKIARVDGGSFLRGLDRGAEQYGLATTAGYVSHTGVGGLTLGGGQGRLQRKFGLSIDNLLGVEIVTADGKLLRANKDENPDLYWAVRGGGGNFGVVTMFEFQLHPLSPIVTSFSYTYAMEDAIDVYKLYFEFGDQASDDMVLSCGMRRGPEGGPSVSLSGTFIGSQKEAEAQLAPMAKFSKKPVNTRISEARYADIQAAGDNDNAAGREFYSRYAFFKQIDPKLPETLVKTYMRGDGPPARTSMTISSQGGLSGRIPESATAYAHRDAPYQLSTSADWIEKSEGPVLMKFCRENHAALLPYINQTTDEGEKQIRDNYRGNYDRLVDVKTKFDPTNFFHLNANIRPRTA